LSESAQLFVVYTDVQELKAEQAKIESLEKHMIEVQTKLDEMEKDLWKSLTILRKILVN